MKSVRRYEVDLDEETPIRLTGLPLAVGNAVSGPGLESWAEHDSTKKEATHTFVIVGTGRSIPEGARYIGTAPRTHDGFVWHLYELKNF